MQNTGRSNLPPVPKNDRARVHDLTMSRLLSIASLPDLDALTQMCQKMFDVDMAAISLVDDKYQWFKSKAGLDLTSTSRDISFCIWVISHGDHLLVENAAEHSFFSNNPFVTSAPYIRFYSGIPLYSKRGYILGTLCIMHSQPRMMSVHEIELQAYMARQAELLIEKYEIEQLAMTDSLTGLYNRRYFDQRARDEISNARRSAQPLSVVVLDIDDFKRINDSFGHSAGDIALIKLARIMKQELRSSDVVSRVGGEEFHILLPNTPETVALRVAERMRVAIKANPIVLGEPSEEPACLTCSFGISSLQAQDHHIDSVLKRADAAMYEAKRQGKDIVVVAAA